MLDDLKREINEKHLKILVEAQGGTKERIRAWAIELSKTEGIKKENISSIICKTVREYENKHKNDLDKDGKMDIKYELNCSDEYIRRVLGAEYKMVQKGGHPEPKPKLTEKQKREKLNKERYDLEKQKKELEKEKEQVIQKEKQLMVHTANGYTLPAPPLDKVTDKINESTVVHIKPVEEIKPETNDKITAMSVKYYTKIAERSLEKEGSHDEIATYVSKWSKDVKDKSKYLVEIYKLK